MVVQSCQTLHVKSSPFINVLTFSVQLTLICFPPLDVPRQSTQSKLVFTAVKNDCLCTPESGTQNFPSCMRLYEISVTTAFFSACITTCTNISNTDDVRIINMFVIATQEHTLRGNISWCIKGWSSHLLKHILQHHIIIVHLQGFRDIRHTIILSVTYTLSFSLTPTNTKRSHLYTHTHTPAAITKTMSTELWWEESSRGTQQSKTKHLMNVWDGQWGSPCDFLGQQKI